MSDFNFTENEKLAALYLVADCLDGMGGSRPMDLEEDRFTWCHVSVLVDAGWSKHEAAGTYGSLESKGALDIEHDTDWLGEGAWVDSIRDELYQWAEGHWDEFEESLRTAA